jgi:hypoxanthine phosphoribosyltransferase
MHEDIDRILISQAQIARRVRELAEQITADHTPPAIPGDGQVTIIPILTGAMIFCADLMRCLPMRMKIGILAVSSYPGRSIKSQGANVLARRIEEVRGRHVVLLDDIIDSGGTVRLVREMLLELQPASLKTCVLLRKATSNAEQTPADYVGFEIPDEFVVGYGLDYDDYYRNLPDIVTLKRHIIDRKQTA